LIVVFYQDFIYIWPPRLVIGWSELQILVFQPVQDRS